MEQNTMLNQIDVGTYFEIIQFLHYELKLLDDRNFDDWLMVLSTDIDYKVPVRVTKEKDEGKEFSNKSFHYLDDYYSIQMRINRLKTKHAWAEDPPSRTRHFISNIQVSPALKDNEYHVTSNLMVYRGRGDSPLGDILSGERHDLIRKIRNGWEVGKRTVLLDQTTLPTFNLSFFI